MPAFCRAAGMLRSRDAWEDSFMSRSISAIAFAAIFSSALCGSSASGEIEERLDRLERRLERIERIFMQVYGARLRAEAPFRENREFAAAVERVEASGAASGIIETLATGTSAAKMDLIGRLCDAASSAAKKGGNVEDIVRILSFLTDNRPLMEEIVRSGTAGPAAESGETLGAFLFAAMALGSQRARLPGRRLMAGPMGDAWAKAEEWSLPVLLKGLKDAGCFEWALEYADMYPPDAVRPAVVNARNAPWWETLKPLARLKVLALLARDGDATVRKEMLSAAEAVMASNTDGAYISMALAPALHSGIAELIPVFLRMVEEQGKGRWGWNYPAYQALVRVIDAGPDAEDPKAGPPTIWNPETRMQKVKRMREWYEANKNKLRWDPAARKFSAAASASPAGTGDNF